MTTNPPLKAGNVYTGLKEVENDSPANTVAILWQAPYAERSMEMKQKSSATSADHWLVLDKGFCNYKFVHVLGSKGDVQQE